VKTGEAILG